MTTTPKALSKYWHIKRVDEESFHIECEGMATATVSTMSHEPMQMLLATMAQELIEPVNADSLSSAGGVEVVAWRWAPSKAFPDFVLSDDRQKAEFAASHGIAVGGLVLELDHLSAITKERKVADGLRDLLLRQSIIVGELSKGLTEDDDLAQEIVNLNTAIDAAIEAAKEG